MSIGTYAERFRYGRYTAFKWRGELGVAQKVGLALGMACLTGLLAQVRFHLWFTPIPFTGQVFAALLGGALLGAGYGALSQTFYMGLGACGVPWFQGWAGGIGYMSRTLTLGYLIGFVVAALVVGWLTDRYVGVRGFFPQLGLMLVGAAIILSMGTFYLGVVLHQDFVGAMQKGFLPFIIPDMLKAAAAAGVATTLLPKASFGREADKSKYPSSY
ncbi:MAG: biotin transporter BioY [Chloroflexi bacterium]|nr:biotin transporter BioY [Chloroflexota bacterium]